MRAKHLFSFFLLLNLLAASIISSGSGQNLKTSLKDLCKFLYSIVGSLAIVMVALSSIAYAAGQMLGAEMRARAVLWSHSLLSGAVIGILMVLLIPPLLAIMLGMSGFDANNCEFYGSGGASSGP